MPRQHLLVIGILLAMPFVGCVDSAAPEVDCQGGCRKCGCPDGLTCSVTMGNPFPSCTAIETTVNMVVISPAADTLAIGEQVQLHAMAYDWFGAPFGWPFRWSSSDIAVASVNNTGLVTAHASGTVTIGATAENITGTASILVASEF